MKILFLLSVSLILPGCAAVAALKGDESLQADGRTYSFQRSGSGPVTVVFESGLGDGMDKWSKVAERVSPLATVLSYDRAGYGASSATSDRRSAIEIVADLRAVLHATGLTPPYVLVGHSLGGLYMQYFARQYPQEVAGLVLVESSHWDQQARMTQDAPGSMNAVKVLSFAMAPNVRAEFEDSARRGASAQRTRAWRCASGGAHRHTAQHARARQVRANVVCIAGRNSDHLPCRTPDRRAQRSLHSARPTRTGGVGH